MPKRVYRTSRGATVDMSTMLTKNETVPAVGNMRVNARGDEIMPDGTITKSRNQLMQEYHNLSTMVPQDGAIPEGGGSVANQIEEDDWQDWEPTPQPVKEPTNVGRMVEEQASQKQEEPSGGLAAAVKQQQTVTSTAKTPTSDKDADGVRRI
tara:strand:- start:719 stop:1174 length:456 start_codon:yes stop_codon:yes gene_type:complete